jgi:hypothetical protein
MTTFDAAAMSPAVTQRLIPSPRRPDASGGQPAYHPRTIGVVDEPLHTGQLPAFAQYYAASSDTALPSRRHKAVHRRRVQLSVDLSALALIVGQALLWSAVGFVAAVVIGAAQ